MIVLTGASGASLTSHAEDEPELTAICTDRPSKSNYACTVEAGHFQYESDLINDSFSRQDGVSSQVLLMLNPTFKYGLSPSVDAEVNISALEVVRIEMGHRATTLASVGDLYLRLKYEFLNPPQGTVQAALIPYVKAPTARVGVGDGAVEGGMLLPVNYEPNAWLTLTLMPEVDIDKDTLESGHHLNSSEVLTLAFAVPDGFTIYGEFWADWNFELPHTIHQRSIDFALAYSVGKYLQLDTGINVGASSSTPRIQAYIGASQKF